MENQQFRFIIRGLVGLVFCLALLSSALLLSGDQYGRVNLLYLLLLFVAWPLLSLIFSVVSVINHSSKNSVSLLLSLPIWPSAWQVNISDLQRSGALSYWLFAQAQKLALAFSVGTVLAFLFVLLFNDVTFVWRSTLLSAEQIFPVLKWLASPWFFIASAQPLPEMVRLAQDSRLSVNPDLIAASSWWSYVLLSQLVYAFLPRSVLYFYAKARLTRFLKRQATASFECANDRLEPEMSEPLKAVSDVIEASQEYVLLSWTELPQVLKQQLYQQLGEPVCEYPLAGQEGSENEAAALKDSRHKILIVAAWEPPLGELADFMQASEGVLIPLDWQEAHFNELSSLHLDEWRRFCYPMQQWQLQLLAIEKESAK